MWSIRDVDEMIRSGPRACVKGIWTPARPLGLFSLVSRLKLAYGVFIGKYDALKWLGQ